MENDIRDQRRNFSSKRNADYGIFKLKSLPSLLLLFMHFSTILCSAKGNPEVYDVFLFGAKGDGKTMDTKAIQSAIDKCFEDGGGKVYLHKGHFISATIILKSNVTLYVEAGAVLQASNDLEDFPSIASKHPSYEGTYETNKMLIYAEDAKNIAIMGRGTINGNGDYWSSGPFGFLSFSIRPRIIHFRGCENIVIRDITLHNSASWVQSYQSCKNMVIDGITVDSRPNKNIEKGRFEDAGKRNNDGLDLIDCEQVRISNSFINSGDDGICLKSLSPEGYCRDITITNCIISSNASAIKIGTESSGRFEDIVVQNCVVYDTRKAAIGIMTVDGASIDRVSISNISMRNIKGAALFIRLGLRNRQYRETDTMNTASLKNIVIQNIQGDYISSESACSISGVSSIPVENILLKDINLRYVGGGVLADSFREIPEQEDAYPGGDMFGTLPAYGLYIRHANNVSLDNVRFALEKDDERPAIFADDVSTLQIENLRSFSAPSSQESIRLKNVRNASISASHPVNDIPTFLTIEGKDSDNIVLINNNLGKAKKSFQTKDTNGNIKIKEIGTIKMK